MSKAAAIPSRVRIGAHSFAIHVGRDGLSSDAFSGESLDHFGATSVKAEVIYLSADISVGMQRSTLVHEILHAVVGCTGQTFQPAEDLANDDIEEYAVRLLTSPLLGVLRDNPDLLAWLLA